MKDAHKTPTATIAQFETECDGDAPVTQKRNVILDTTDDDHDSEGNNERNDAELVPQRVAVCKWDCDKPPQRFFVSVLFLFIAVE